MMLGIGMVGGMIGFGQERLCLALPSFAPFASLLSFLLGREEPITPPIPLSRRRQLSSCRYRHEGIRQRKINTNNIGMKEDEDDYD